MICRNTDTILSIPDTTIEEDDCIELITVQTNKPIMVEYIDIINDRAHFITATNSRPKVKCFIINKHSTILPGLFTNKSKPLQLKIPYDNFVPIMSTVIIKAIIVMQSSLYINKNINFMNDCIVFNKSLFQYKGIAPASKNIKYCDICRKSTSTQVSILRDMSMCKCYSENSTNPVKTITIGGRLFDYLRKVAPHEITHNFFKTSNFINNNDNITIVAYHI